MKYGFDKIVRLVCGDNWETQEVSLDERDGGYGVALCLAYLQRPSTNLNELADIIGCHPRILDMAYRRLQFNGVLSQKSLILKDPDLLMNNANSDEDMMRSLKAWCHIAGLASGFIGIAVSRQDLVERRTAK